MTQKLKKFAVLAAQAASSKKGEDILLLRPGKKSPLADYWLFVTATSRPHLEALEWEIKKSLKEGGLDCLHRAKPASDHWRALDFGGLMVHIMTAETRSFYALEKLYADSPVVDWELEHSLASKGA